jgi:hypothetical protein
MRLFLAAGFDFFGAISSSLSSNIMEASLAAASE